MNRNLLLSGLFACIFLASCSSPEADKATITDDLRAYSETINPTQVFEIDPTVSAEIVGAQGTRITFPAGSLVDARGNPATKPVKVLLKEVYTLSEMVLNDAVTTTTSGQLLQTSGMVNVQAAEGDTPLEIADGSYIMLDYQGVAYAPNMRTYLADTDATGVTHWALDTNNVYDTTLFTEERIMTLAYGADIIQTVTYGIIGPDTVELSHTPTVEEAMAEYRASDNYDGDSAIYADSAATPRTYRLRSTSLGWINCDYFLGQEDLINVQFATPASGRWKNYLAFPDLPALMRTWDPQKLQFQNIPRNRKVVAISIWDQDGNYWLGTQELTLSETGQTITLDYQAKTMEEINEALKGYN